MNALHEQLRGLESHVEAAMGGAAVQLQPIPGAVPVDRIRAKRAHQQPGAAGPAETP